MKSQASYPVIPVNQLKPGMYVIAIASQTGGMEIAQMGLVTSVAQIANLVRQGCSRYASIWPAANWAVPKVTPLPPRPQYQQRPGGTPGQCQR